jgi:hypothetical protein
MVDELLAYELWSFALEHGQVNELAYGLVEFPVVAPIQ